MRTPLLLLLLILGVGLASGADSRPKDDLARDADRKPIEVLKFFGIVDGMSVVDLQAAKGYYTELLSSAVGSSGSVIAQNNNFVLTRFAEKPLSQRIARLEAAGVHNITRLDAELDELELPAGLDAAVFVRFYHDLYWLPTPDGDKNDRAEFLRRVHDALVPGGIFGVIDHHAEAGSGDRDAVDPREGLHRVDAELVMAEILAAGFVLDGESDLLSNPDDTRDWNIFADDAINRDKTDRFVWRFIKPRE
ncbi:MAG: SAM-dependent methyltransferase [Acidobacteriota bacterium]|nr:SAM-dependent methyltransferase [Acidobacteriota bacterium]MDH3785192.1 SAM-dependent methyltransferase [Acidobacteriota bacterium]